MLEIELQRGAPKISGRSEKDMQLVNAMRGGCRIRGETVMVDLLWQARKGNFRS